MLLRSVETTSGCRRSWAPRTHVSDPAEAQARKAVIAHNADHVGEEEMTRFSVLGPMECWLGERPVKISGTLQRTLLATLLASDRQPVSVDALVEELWGD